MKHREHPREMFSRHQESAKHIDANKTKYSVLKIIHKKGNIKDRLKRGFMNKKANEEEENKSVITKFFKITYFLSKKKWTVKNNFSDIVGFLKDVRDKEIVNFFKKAWKTLHIHLSLQLKIISATLVIILRTDYLMILN